MLCMCIFNKCRPMTVLTVCSVFLCVGKKCTHRVRSFRFFFKKLCFIRTEMLRGTVLCNGNEVTECWYFCVSRSILCTHASYALREFQTIYIPHYERFFLTIHFSCTVALKYFLFESVSKQYSLLIFCVQVYNTYIHGHITLGGTTLRKYFLMMILRIQPKHCRLIFGYFYVGNINGVFRYIRKVFSYVTCGFWSKLDCFYD